ncbi:glucose-1-phosphate adenylyltransferase [Candidatus Woesearchaeota archaeon]|nr:glucose-1-phosphate adenylyltransferase [Candidatus Woesearchaeota archaeon]
MTKNNTLAFVLGGGEGKRLYPLTRDRAKPSVPFGANFRVIDFVLSNLYNSGIRKIYVLAQYESFSLHKHLKNGWYPKFGTGVREFISMLQPAHGHVERWYSGTADAIHQNLRYVSEEKPKLVDVFGGDHIYLMDVNQMNDFHTDYQADLTISAMPVRKELAANTFGVLIVDKKWQLIGFEEKPTNPTPMPNNPDFCLASMGNYVFKPDVLMDELVKDAKKDTTRDKEVAQHHPDNLSTHDFGFDVIPAMLRDGKKILVYNFLDNIIEGMSPEERGYWRDIGNLDQFYEANMEFRKEKPQLNLYNPEWGVLTFIESSNPAKFISEGGKKGSGAALDSIVANGSVIDKCIVERSVISYNVTINPDAKVSDSILLGYINIGERAVVQKAIIDRGVNVPKGEVIGLDKAKDKKRGFTISQGGLTVVPRNYKFPGQE